jgi:alkanesulfonate monooxygenase SsuD/methylene tetrahydromethanopterin reductase-like flavin-dependent oxidoreductase (luciferase family)
MRFGVCVSNFGTYADPHASVSVARAAAAAGWEAFFTWDHLAFVWNGPSADPWVTLAAVASATEGLLLGTAVTPLPRRRPQVVAEQLGTLDRLNRGGVVLGAGLGGNEREFTEFGEDFDPHRRATLLDDGLHVVRGLWNGPLWIGGNGPRALRRAGRWDGWIPDSLTQERIEMSVEQLAASVERIGRGPTFDTLFDVAFNGYSEPGDGELARSYEQAGATWWLENFHDRRCDLAATLARIEAGPPRG